jgi:hypothetical protein
MSLVIYCSPASRNRRGGFLHRLGRPIWKRKIGKSSIASEPSRSAGIARCAGSRIPRRADATNTRLFRGKGNLLRSAPAEEGARRHRGAGGNAIFAVLVLAVVWGVGFEVPDARKPRVLASDIEQGQTYPPMKRGS